MVCQCNTSRNMTIFIYGLANIGKSQSYLPDRCYLIGLSATTDKVWLLRKTWMNELITHVFSLRPIRSDRLLSHRHTSKAPLGDASKRRALRAFSDLPQSPKPAKNLTESFSPAICFKVGSQVRDSSCNCLPLPGLTFIFHPLLHFPFAFSSACVIPLYFLLPLFIQSLPFAVGSNRSLNHLGQGSVAKCYPLYCSNAAVLSFCSFFFLHILAFVSIYPSFFLPFSWHQLYLPHHTHYPTITSARSPAITP